MDGWSWRAEFARRRLAARFAEEGREHPGFCAALVVARGERGLTIEEMAAELGCGPATLQALEAGLIPPERAPASVRELLAASLGVPPDVAVEAAEAAVPARSAATRLQEAAPETPERELVTMAFLAGAVRLHSPPPDELAARRRLRSGRRSSQLRARRRAPREGPPSGETPSGEEGPSEA